MSAVLSDSPSQPTFRDLNLSAPIVEAVEASGYSIPTPIQAQTIPLLLEGRDVLGQAQTGTGKTAAFALPMLQRIDLAQRHPQVLVLAPTRELAIQVAEAFQRYAANMPGLRVAAIYGGQDYGVQFRQLDRGVHVVVGTPGRVMDHMRRGSLNLNALSGLVLDEADEMLRMGFAEDVQWVLTQLSSQPQIALFSATLADPIRRIAQQHQRNPAEITIEQRTATADTIRQRYLVVGPQQKQAALGRILEAEPVDGALVFVKTKSTTEPLTAFLAGQGRRAAALSGDVPQKQRERIVESLRSGELDVLVATDVAARGLDVQRVSHVINYDLPMDSEAYVHRIGRTGRAGRSGEAILFVHPRERRMLKKIEQATRQTIEPMELPNNRAINKQRVARFHERITEGLAHPDLETAASIVDQYRRENDLPLEQIAASLAVLAGGNASLLLTEELKQSSFASDSRKGSGEERFRHSPRNERGGSGARSEEAMETYRLEVGHTHLVKPGNIVGAIAGETGLDSGRIGRIQIFDDFSTVDLPEGMPPTVFQTLRNVRVAGQRLNLSRFSGSRPRAGKPPFKKGGPAKAHGGKPGAPGGKMKRKKQFAK